MVNAQKWLDREYPNKKTMLIYINQQLEGVLDCSGYDNLWEISISAQVDSSKFEIKKGSYKDWNDETRKHDKITETKIIPCIPAQDYLNKEYPKEKRAEVKKLVISEKDLEGNLDLSDFPNLKELYCLNNILTSLNISNCKKLVEVDCRYNNFPNQYLINEYGLCLKCYQPNTSERWCQPCAEKEWSQLEGQELIEKFIKQQGKDWQGKPKLQWMPYEQFTNIEYLASGGFSKIYKAKRGRWMDVVLKSLNNSQNITSEFLIEITNTKLVDGGSNIVECRGISQDPTTKNYLMVMDYMEKGNLREYLKNNYSELSWKDKLHKLYCIANGLYEIHRKNLVHRDFHSGNILNIDDGWRSSFITDLGLSKLVNSQTKAGEIMGVLPYVAPEVLRGQPYTQASDIYSFGIVAYELLVNSYPYSEMSDLELSLKVCQGLRPDIDKVPIPQKVKDLIKSCWDADPEKRPSALELCRVVIDWQNKGLDEEKEYKTFSQNTPYQIHSNATLTSKMIDTKQIIERLKTVEQERVEDQELDELDINDFGELSIQEDNQEQDWTNIHPNFTLELIQSWQNLNFTYQQTQEWINTGLQPTDYNFCAWLRDNKHFTPEQVLNNHNLEQLNQEFFAYRQEQQQSNIEIPPK